MTADQKKFPFIYCYSSSLNSLSLLWKQKKFRMRSYCL